MPDTIGYRFKIFRESLGVTQAVFAENIELSPAAIGLVEKDKSFFKAENLKKLILLYNLNLNWLLTGEGEMFLKSKNTFAVKLEPLFIDKFEFGKRLNKIRIVADIVSGQMAELLGINERKLAKYISGEEKPTIDFVRAVCESFEVTADWLLFGKE